MDTHVVRLAPLATLLSQRLATIVSHKRSRTVDSVSKCEKVAWIQMSAKRIL